MATKRGPSPELISNPFIKKRNLEWSLELSGPTHDSDESSDLDEPHDEAGPEEGIPGASAVEAGKAKIDDHLSYFGELLEKATLSPFPAGAPRLSIESYQKLYETNAGSPQGAHFIVHQHDHPIAGTHYDLRLQINETSSASWAIMYGLPGDPNSQRPNRNATETRIHCLWNHLIETASSSTGSLLIWDTGTYTVLPARSKRKRAGADSQSSENEDGDEEDSGLTQQQKLHRAFQARKIRIRLNGTRLPRNYVLNLRLTTGEDVAGRVKSLRASTRRRRRGGSVRGRGRGRGRAAEPDTTSGSDSDLAAGDGDEDVVHAPAEQADTNGAAISPMEREIRELEDARVRRTNAYAGAANSVGSVHQRRWYLSLDREACGFAKRRRTANDGGGEGVVWEAAHSAGGIGDPSQTGVGAERGVDGVKGDKGGSGDRGDRGGEEYGVDGADADRLSFPFYVRGVEVERSVVTGRTGADVLRDEGVVGFVGRKGWRPVLK